MQGAPIAGKDDSDSLDDLNKLEAAFYTSGYEAGFEHGKAHGTFEGRALGQEKGFEIFEELYYYAGQAQFWQAVSATDPKKQKALSHINQLLILIAQYPLFNDTSGVASDQDLEALMATIRSKYRVMCSSLGVRPRIQQSGLSM